MIRGAAMKSNEKAAYLPQQISEYAGLLRSKIWTIGVVTLALTLAAITGIAFLPDQYRATTTILVDPQQIPDRYVTATVSSDPSERLNTITQQVLSGSRLGQIIDEMNLYADSKGKPREDVIENMRRHITLQVKQGSAQGLSSFTITYESGSASVAAKVANRLAASFIEWNLRNREQLAEDTTRFISSQLDEAKQNLQSQEAKLREFKMEHIGQMPEQVPANLQTLTRLQTVLQTNSDALNRLEQDKQLLSRLPDPAPAVPAQMTERQRLELEQRTLTSQVWDLKKKYTDSHPDVIAAETRLKQVQDQLKSAPSDPAAVKDTSATAVRIELIEKEEQRLAKQNRDVESQIAIYQGKVDSVPLREQELSELTRDYEISKEQYKSLLEKTFSAEMATDLEKRQQGERFNILDPARPPDHPFKPNRLNLMMAALAAAFFFSVALVIVQDNINGAIKSERELKDLLPARVMFLGSVPTIEIRAEQRRKAWLRTVAVAVSVLGCLIVAVILWKVHPIL
jgi:polysaccharide chain length determinant protein (PEP-CTERM system associated)